MAHRPPDATPPAASTANQATGDHTALLLQIGTVNGPVAVHGEPALPATGLVSTAPPVERAPGPLHGRDPLLDTLTDTVLRHDGTTIALHGCGGSGKTALALALAARLADHGQVRVWWVDATTDRTLSAGFREIALDAGAPVDQVIAAWSGTRSPIGVLSDALAATPLHTLVVLDNADDTRTVTPWLPALRRHAGTVLITTRDGQPDTWPPDTRLHHLGPLADRHAADMLCALAPDAGTRDQALRLGRTLGGLPLALHLAGRYLAAAARRPPVSGVDLPLDFDHYRHVFATQFPHVDHLHRLGGRLDDRTLLTRTWELTLDLLTDLGLPHARPLLRWLAGFAPAPLPSTVVNADILARSPKFPAVTGIDVVRTVAALNDFGLLDETTFHDPRASTASTRCLLLHPVIREANRHQPDLDDAPHPYLALCVAVLDGATTHLTVTDPAHLSHWAALAPHCEHIVDHIARRDDLPDTWELLATKLTRTIAVLAHLTGAHARAHTLFAHVLDTRRRHLGDHHPDVLTLHRDIAWLRFTRNPRTTPDHTRRSHTEFTDLVRRCAAHLGDHHPLTQSCRFDLAWITAAATPHAHPDVVDGFRAVVHAERQALGHNDLSGLAAQTTLVARLWHHAHETRRPTDLDTLDAEFRHLLAILTEIGRHPEVHDALPIPYEQLTTTTATMYQRFRQWRQHPATT